MSNIVFRRTASIKCGEPSEFKEKYFTLLEESIKRRKRNEAKAFSEIIRRYGPGGHIFYDSGGSGAAMS